MIKCYDVIDDPGRFSYIITELCSGGDLDLYVKRRGFLAEEMAGPFIRNILEGLIYLSSKDIVHRDLKVANVFISGNTVKIADFGFAVFAKYVFH